MNTDEFYLKFPSVLRKALQSGVVSFDELPCETSFEPIPVYRVIKRQLEEQDNIEIKEQDFLSQAELNAISPKGTEAKDLIGDIGKYSCSFSLTKEWLQNIFKLPKKTKLLIYGTINETHGAINRDSIPHIHCWIYKDVSLVKEFVVEE